MQALRRLRTRLHTRYFPSDSLSLRGVPSLEGVTPLYDRKPVWWARWTYPLVCANILVTSVHSHLFLLVL